MSEIINQYFGVTDQREETNYSFYKYEQSGKECKESIRSTVKSNANGFWETTVNYLEWNSVQPLDFRIGRRPDPILLPYILTYYENLVNGNFVPSKDEIEIKLRDVADQIMLYPFGALNSYNVDVEKYYDITHILSDHIGLTISKTENVDLPDYYILYNYNTNIQQCIVIESSQCMARDPHILYNIYFLSDKNEDAFIQCIAKPIIEGSQIYSISILKEILGDMELDFSYRPYRKGQRVSDIRFYKNKMCKELNIFKSLDTEFKKIENKAGNCLIIPHLITMLNGKNSDHLLFTCDPTMEKIKELVSIETVSNRGINTITAQSSFFEINLD